MGHRAKKSPKKNKVVMRKADSKGRITLNASFADHLVIIEQVADDEVRVRKAQALPRKYTLEELLAGVTEENKHGEISTGPSVGNEAW